MSLQIAEMVPAQWLSTSDLVTTRRKTRRYPPIFNISEVTLWRWVKRGYFPEPRYIGGKARSLQGHSLLMPPRRGGFQHERLRELC